MSKRYANQLEYDLKVLKDVEEREKGLSEFEKKQKARIRESNRKSVKKYMEKVDEVRIRISGKNAEDNEEPDGFASTVRLNKRFDIVDYREENEHKQHKRASNFGEDNEQLNLFSQDVNSRRRDMFFDETELRERERQLKKEEIELRLTSLFSDAESEKEVWKKSALCLDRSMNEMVIDAVREYILNREEKIKAENKNLKTQLKQITEFWEKTYKPDFWNYYNKHKEEITKGYYYREIKKMAEYCIFKFFGDYSRTDGNNVIKKYLTEKLEEQIKKDFDEEIVKKSKW